MITENLEEKTLYINIQGNISELLFKKIIKESEKDIKDRISKNKYNHLTIFISSKGGDVWAGLSLYNFFKSLGVDITTYNYGFCDSSASVIFCVGNKRITAPQSQFLIHDILINLTGVFPRKIIKEQIIKQLDKQFENLISVYKSVIGNKKEREEIISDIEASKILTAQEAKDYGLVTEIKELTLPKGTESNYFVYQEPDPIPQPQVQQK